MSRKNEATPQRSRAVLPQELQGGMHIRDSLTGIHGKVGFVQEDDGGFDVIVALDRDPGVYGQIRVYKKGVIGFIPGRVLALLD